MYEAYFGLEKRPFAATPDVSCAFLPDPVQVVLNELLLRVEAGEGISLLTAPAGTGKTLLCRKLADELAVRLPTIYLPSANFPTRRALFQAILYELDAPYNGLDEQELRLALQSQLKNLASQGKSLLLILDEAHLLSTRLLEEVRSLADLSENGKPLLRVLLSGQPALEERLVGPELDAVNQRLACHVYLEPFTQTLAREYVVYRVNCAVGNAQALFTPDALDLIAHGSNGLPRCINQLCDHSLLLAFVADSHEVTRQVVEDALQDLKQLPLHWNDALPAASPLESVRRSTANVTETTLPVPRDVPQIPEPAAESAAMDPATETYVFEFGAEADEYPLAHASTLATPAVAQTPSENAPSDQDDPLYQPSTSFPGPFESFDLPETVPTIPLNRFQTGAAEKDGGWEPVVEDNGVGMSQETYEAPRSLPPTRRGVVPLLDLPVQRFSGFQEERVDDLYARIDAGIAGRTGNSLTTPQFNPAAEAPRGENGLPGIPHAPGEPPLTFDQPVTWQLLPDQMIDRIVPLLDEVVSNDEPGVPTLPSAAASIHTDSQASIHAEEEELEETVGGEVLDLCLEVQDYFARELTRNPPSAELPNERESTREIEEQSANLEFDVIEPEPEAHLPPIASRFHVDSGHNVSEGNSTTGHAVPRPNYRRIFSMLRRKLGR